ncbi:hypothetical protein DFH09DRAFT_1350931 [Mycena vulgaris]|nr:hypothetical protein DFH09DRAFT_1350931 [Mycena vulgaris]
MPYAPPTPYPRLVWDLPILTQQKEGSGVVALGFLTFPAFFTTICYRTAYAMPWLLPHLPYPLIFLPPRAETPSSPIELSVVPHSPPPRYSSPAFRRSIPSRPHPALLVHTFSRTFHTYSSSFLPLLPILPSIFTVPNANALLRRSTPLLHRYPVHHSLPVATTSVALPITRIPRPSLGLEVRYALWVRTIRYQASQAK